MGSRWRDNRQRRDAPGFNRVSIFGEAIIAAPEVGSPSGMLEESIPRFARSSLDGGHQDLCAGTKHGATVAQGRPAFGSHPRPYE